MKYFEVGKDNPEIMAIFHGEMAAQQPERFLKEVIRAHEERSHYDG